MRRIGGGSNSVVAEPSGVLGAMSLPTVGVRRNDGVAPSACLSMHRGVRLSDKSTINRSRSCVGERRETRGGSITKGDTLLVH